MTNDIAAAIKHVEIAVAFELGEGNHLTALFCYQSAALDHPRLPNIRIRDLASPDGEPDVVPSDSGSTGNIFTRAASTSKSSEIQNALINPRAAIVFDDLQSTDLLTPRRVKVRGAADIVER